MERIWKGSIMSENEDDEDKYDVWPEYGCVPEEETWFDKFINWIRRLFS
jgi:hypothetical protein